MSDPLAGEAGSAPRYAYLGTSGFAATVLAVLVARGHVPALVVTPPDRRQGRGRRVAPPPAAAKAAELGLELHQTPDVNAPESRARLDRAQVELGLVCAFGQLIRDDLLAALDLLNVHPSLLPRWRGAAPIERAIMAGDERTGVAIMRVAAELDAGPVALVEAVAIEPGEDFGSLERRLAGLGGDLAARALDLWSSSDLAFEPQDEGRVTYAEKITADDRRLDPGRSAIELERQVRALTPHIGAFLELAGGGRLGISRATPAPGAAPAPGALEPREGGIALGCADGALLLERVRPPGKRDMAASDYLRGHPLPRVA